MPLPPVNRERLLSCFLQLVRIPSLSGHESRVAELVAGELAGLGLAVERDQAHQSFGGDTGNVIGRLPGEGEPILLCAHLDTAGPAEGVCPQVRAGRITSDGTTVLGADDKAAVAGLLEGLRTVVAHALPHPPLELLFTVAEEVGLKGSLGLEPGSLRSRMAFVADSAGPVGTIVNRGPGQDGVRAVVTGRAAHAGVAPEKGVSAIQIAARGIAAMRLGRIDEETTANIGLIRGGTATNIVPDRVELEGEARSHDDAKRVAQVQHMVACLHQAAAELGGGLEVEITPRYERFCVPESHPAVALAKQALRELGVRARLGATGGGSDANVFNAGGMPAVLLGVGYDNCHARDEFIRVGELERFAQLVVALITTAAGRASGR